MTCFLGMLIPSTHMLSLNHGSGGVVLVVRLSRALFSLNTVLYLNCMLQYGGSTGVSGLYNIPWFLEDFLLSSSMCVYSCRNPDGYVSFCNLLCPGVVTSLFPFSLSYSFHQTIITPG